ncbi:MAG: PD-(D/E)XK motif protein [Oscillospiraceae bacterium]
MSNAIKIYQEIIADLKKPENSNFSVLNRSILLKNRIRIVYIVAAKDVQRIIAVMLPKDCKKDPLNRFPKWHGIEFSYDRITEYQNPNSESEYIIISQSKDYDGGIFEIIANDITDQLEKISTQKKMFSCLSDTLSKWKKFFALNSDVIMSEQMQEGLYGELLVLKKLIYNFGNEAVSYWSGADKETHDFYVNGSAVEVKTAASKSTEKIKISSEHQLNPKDVENSLYLYVNMVRKSRVDGETLPDIIENIQSGLSESHKSLFLEKLFQYGYIPSCEERYTLGFHLRSHQTYKVEYNFPNIVPDNLDNGISEVTYSLDLNACTDFVTEWDDVVNTMKGGILIGKP